MKLSDFILLNEDQKKLAVLHDGILVAKRIIPNYMVFLFQLESYYVETFCNRQNKAVEEFRVFDSVKPLNPYLDSIPIESLL
jgi:hypothetical protein